MLLIAKINRQYFRPKPPRLSGQHADRLLQIRVAGQQCADGRVEAKDCKADRKHIHALNFTKQQR